MFRYKPSIPVPYERQGYVYFKSLRYAQLPQTQQDQIRGLCERVAGANGAALLEHVTTGADVKSVCRRYYIASPTTLYRALRRYYVRFPVEL